MCDPICKGSEGELTVRDLAQEIGVSHLQSPIQDLRVHQLAAFYSDNKPDVNRYRLVSAIVHVGDVHTGHFITYRRAPSKCQTPVEDAVHKSYSSQWLYTSDTFVRKASKEEVYNSSAYMLFYERM